MAESQRTPHALYRFYDAQGSLLYIGITLNPSQRWATHSKDKPWWSDVANITIEQHPDRASVLAAERAAILAEGPRHNVVHNQTPTDPLAHLYQPNRPDSMPDDCHEHCARKGIVSIYYPYAWSNGRAFYRCNRGHTWTCRWGLVKGAGEDLTNAGNPIQQLLEIEENATNLAPFSRKTAENALRDVEKVRGEFLSVLYRTWPKCRWQQLPRSVDRAVLDAFDAGMDEDDLKGSIYTALSQPHIDNRGAYLIGILRNRITELAAGATRG